MSDPTPAEVWRMMVEALDESREELERWAFAYDAEDDGVPDIVHKALAAAKRVEVTYVSAPDWTRGAENVAALLTTRDDA